jgi:hypothetical protein
MAASTGVSAPNSEPAIKVGDTVLVVGRVIALWAGEPPEIPPGYQIRFEGTVGASYRPIAAVVAPRRNVRPLPIEEMP